MTYRLLIGQRSWSSWSLRGWMSFAAFGLPVEVSSTKMYSDAFARDVAAFGGAGTVPVVRTPEGGILSDSLAIAWHLAERFPDAGLLPGKGPDRDAARSMIAEMHSGFSALRGACPMNLRTAWAGFEPEAAVRADLARIETIWGDALARSGGPFLFGGYTLADAFFAPVAARIAGYGLPVSETARAYVSAHLHHGPFRRWRAMGATEGPDLPQYDLPLARAPFPAPAPIPARATETGTPENAACPYSGRPVSHLAEIGGRVFGFCNAVCRDKTVADPEAWPDFMAMRGA